MLNSQDFRVRRIAIEDMPSLLELNERLVLNSNLPGGNWDYWSPIGIRRSFDSEEGWGLVDAQNQILGFVFWKSLDSTTFEIQKLGVDPNHQRMGHMFRLLSGLISGLKPGFQVWLETHEQNVKARKLYEKFGFKCVGSRKNYYEDGGAAILYSFSV